MSRDKSQNTLVPRQVAPCMGLSRTFSWVARHVAEEGTCFFFLRLVARLQVQSWRNSQWVHNDLSCYRVIMWLPMLSPWLWRERWYMLQNMLQNMSPRVWTAYVERHVAEHSCSATCRATCRLVYGRLKIVGRLITPCCFDNGLSGTGVWWSD